MINGANNAKGWMESTLIESFQAASNVMGLRFKIPDWPGHLPGQHVDVRLTAPDGYMAERSYSIANDFNGSDLVELGVELLENGEVSPYLWMLKPGDKIEIKGPIGGHFIWKSDMPGPLVLVAGGAGMVPLMCMLRHHISSDSNRDRKVVFIISVRSADKILYEREIQEIGLTHPNVSFAVTITESAPADWKGYARRIDNEMLEAEVGSLKEDMPEIYVCGPTKFVEAAASIFISMGFNSHSIKTERFGG